MSPLVLTAATAAKKHVLPLALFALFLTLVAALGLQNARLTSARLSLEAETAGHATTQLALDAQSAGMRAVADKAAAVKAASLRAVARAEQVTVAAEKRARALENAPAPATCEDAIQFLVRDAAGGAVE